MNAKEKLVQILARRSHSVREIRDKLSRKYSASEIREALEWAEEHRFLEDPHELAAKVVQSLERKGKGPFYIKKYLYTKGLPDVKVSDDEELEVARAVAVNKLRLSPPYNDEEKKKLSRMLTYRGFKPATIRKIIYEKS